MLIPLSTWFSSKDFHECNSRKLAITNLLSLIDSFSRTLKWTHSSHMDEKFISYSFSRVTSRSSRENGINTGCLASQVIWWSCCRYLFMCLIMQQMMMVGSTSKHWTMSSFSTCWTCMATIQLLASSLTKAWRFLTLPSKWFRSTNRGSSLSTVYYFSLWTQLSHSLTISVSNNSANRSSSFAYHDSSSCLSPLWYRQSCRPCWWIFFSQHWMWLLRYVSIIPRNSWDLGSWTPQQAKFSFLTKDGLSFLSTSGINYWGYPAEFWVSLALRGSKRKLGRPRKTWKMQVEKERKGIGLEKKDAMNRARWRIGVREIAAGVYPATPVYGDKSGSKLVWWFWWYSRGWNFHRWFWPLLLLKWSELHSFCYPHNPLYHRLPPRSRLHLLFPSKYVGSKDIYNLHQSDNLAWMTKNVDSTINLI